MPALLITERAGGCNVSFEIDDFLTMKGYSTEYGSAYMRVLSPGGCLVASVFFVRSHEFKQEVRATYAHLCVLDISDLVARTLLRFFSEVGEATKGELIVSYCPVRAHIRTVRKGFEHTISLDDNEEDVSTEGKEAFRKMPYISLDRIFSEVKADCDKQ